MPHYSTYMTFYNRIKYRTENKSVPGTEDKDRISLQKGTKEFWWEVKFLYNLTAVVVT